MSVEKGHSGISVAILHTKTITVTLFAYFVFLRFGGLIDTVIQSNNNNCPLNIKLLLYEIIIK